MKVFYERAKNFFKARPDLLKKLKRDNGTYFWTQKEIAQFDRVVFEGCTASIYTGKKDIKKPGIA
ncbi:hypothetical protein GW537_06725 [Piscirickettsia salmonis]|nr:hypothetical protein GW538_09655 [Piscirickettsia salmonis]RNC77579.1 hypothetical protein DA717_09480 [Piscirickettsiaceae bacterium NZ-RLO2]WGZ73008.1 hypothetical protein E3220_05310 [Piscirickettsia salmonis EM-90]QHS30526.1 hypothetical protein GW537_06725 [Piscirickettsia salmonis]QHS33939.1 hypothetical protein GW535_04625 [Piscirickettsia salmonis]